MATCIHKVTKEIQLPKVAYASLLTEEECEAGSDYIPDVVYSEAFYTGCWYLRTPYEDNMIMYAAGNSPEEPAEPDWEDPGPEEARLEIEYGTGNRPALYFESSLIDAGAALGDQIEIGGATFTVILDKVALLDDYISVEIFDEETNDYERSAIKQRVDNWFENVIKPYL